MCVCLQRRPLFYRIISRKSAGPRKCLFNKTVSCRRDGVSVCVCVHETLTEAVSRERRRRDRHRVRVMGREGGRWGGGLRRRRRFLSVTELRHLENITGTPASVC